MIWNLPNLLTVMRLVAAPGIVIMFLYFSRPLADWIALVLFLVAAISDWFDGYLARRWNQESKFGEMLDPIADKAMVIIALLIITGFSRMNSWVLLPSAMIMFREVFVSGLREFLGKSASLLTVTKLAKWKTALQMIAIATLFSQGIFQYYLEIEEWGMNKNMLETAISEITTERESLTWMYWGAYVFWIFGVLFLWIAGILTFITGIDYLKKSLPYLKDDNL
ncbi:MAG: CDP-diacylglycerol--glycerol-3-phosphate 3-phosphatidyltransferase [Paracoccaceae bacterium]